MKERDVPKELRGKQQKGKHPLKEFTQMMGEVQRGMGRLDRTVATLSKPSQAKTTVKEMRSFISKESVRDRKSPGLREVIRERAVPASITRTTFKDASAPRLPAIYPTMRSPHSAMRYKIKDLVHGPEDREAITHIREVVRPLSYEGLPRAVRAALAQEMQSSNPERDIRASLPDSPAFRAGGQNSSRRHWRPEIARMVERYQSTLNLVSSRLERAERAVYGTTVSPSSKRTTNVNMTSNTSIPNLPKGASAEALLDYNDIAHISAQGERYERETRKQRSLPSTSAPSRKASGEHRLPDTAGGYRGPSGSAGNGGASTVPGPRKLSGTLTLTGQNGSVIGSAKLDATEG